jgi:hypothetical protein
MTAGWTKVQIAPRPADLGYLAGIVPTPQGPLTARYTIEGGIIREAHLSVPPGVHATIEMPLGSPADLLIVDDMLLSSERSSTDAVNSRTSRSIMFELPDGGEHLIVVRTP